MTRAVPWLAVAAFILLVALAQQIGVVAGHGLAPWNLP